MTEKEFYSRVLNSLDALHTKHAALDKKVAVLVAELPSQFVPRSEINEAKKAEQNTRRWAFSTLVATFVAVLSAVLAVIF